MIVGMPIFPGMTQPGFTWPYAMRAFSARACR